tara:strand:+ start:168 stop:839 length:672 start_codon:yes stop_codon:yes gene_type:complete
MGKIAKKTNFNIKQLTAIERLAVDPGYKTTKLCQELKVDPDTIRKWKNNVGFISAVYDRFMDVAGRHMPDVIMAQIREAMAGNTQAATLVLKHFGKFQDSLTIKIESPFDQFLKTNNVEEAELVTEDEAIEFANSFELPERPKIPRDPINDKPQTRVQRENKKVKEIYSRQKYLDNRNERYSWLRRAKKLGIEPLGAGRPSKEKLRAWRDSIVEAENRLARGE